MSPNGDERDVASYENGGGNEERAVPSETERDRDDWEAPPKHREPLLRDRIRERLGLSPRQWYVVETFLLVLPYPVFVLVYVTFDPNEALFLGVTLLYSLVAMYVGFVS